MRRLAPKLLLRTKRRLVGVVTLFFVLATFLVSAVYVASTPQRPEKPWYNLPAQCRLPDSLLDDLSTLALRMHAALVSLNVPHALCYGTLWGALRMGRVLPWDTNVDMCAMDSHFANVSTSQLQEAFGKRGMELHYDWRRGQYNVSFRGGAEGYISVFTKTSSWDHSVEEEIALPGGWNRAIWRWFGQKQASFPAWLLEAPFNTKKFHEEDLPVPHDGIELLKYHYPNDWWLEAKPPGCL